MPVVRVGVERAPHARRVTSTKRSTSSSAPASLVGSGVRNQRRTVEEIGECACSARRSRRPRSDDRGRTAVVDRAASARFVEPTSVTVASGPGGGEHLRVVCDQRPDRHRDDDELGVRDALRRARPAGVDQRPRRPPRARSLRRRRSRATAARRRRFAASATEVPRSPVPTIAASSYRRRRARRPRLQRRRRGSAELLLHDVEHRREDRAGRPLRQRTGVGAASSTRGGARPRAPRRSAGAGLALVLLTRATSSSRRFRAWSGPVELPDLLSEAAKVVHQGSFSDFSRPSVLSVRLNPVAHTDIQEVSNANDADAAR